MQISYNRFHLPFTRERLIYGRILYFRGKISRSEMDKVGTDMEARINEAGAMKAGNPVTATFGIEGEYLDVEILQPINKNIGSIGDYQFKEKIKIVNAVVASYKGNPIGLQGACNELNQYITEKKLQPITVGYNVPKHINPVSIEDTEIDIYVGISPNIL